MLELEEDGSIRTTTKGHRSGATVSHSWPDPNLVSAAGLIPMIGLAESAGLRELADERLTVPTDKGANVGSMVAALVAGMVAGVD